MHRAVPCLIPHHNVLCAYVQSVESGVHRYCTNFLLLAYIAVSVRVPRSM
jgi:hypothetical protein